MHFDIVEVSGANQYKVNPAEFVSTVFPPMVFVDSGPVAASAAALDGAELLPAPAPLPPPLPAAVLLPAAAGLPLATVDPDELPHAATASAIAASPAAPHIFRIRDLLTVRNNQLLGITYRKADPFMET
ncbi:MAG TPA: hypothetical protein VGG16_17815 [Streptosporangiaceae bacterium]